MGIRIAAHCIGPIYCFLIDVVEEVVGTPGTGNKTIIFDLKMRVFALGVIIAACTSVLLNMDVFRPMLRYIISSIIPKAPLDNRIFRVPKLSTHDLSVNLANRRALIVGGTRGVGRGISLALAAAGTDVTIVGRSRESGEKVLAELRGITNASKDQKFRYVQGDLSTVASTHELVDRLAQEALNEGRFDFLAQTAAIFPDWEQPHQQEDGLEKCFAVGVVGRFIVCSQMHRFMRTVSAQAVGGGTDDSPPPAVVVMMNVMTGGDLPFKPFDRDIATGKKPPSNLIEALACVSLGNEVMQIMLESYLRDIRGDLQGVTMVSTHPGLLKTELHRGQGMVFDAVESLGVFLVGVSEEEAGVRHASILAAAATGGGEAGRGHLPEGKLSYVDSELWGRQRSAQLQKEYDEQHTWLWEHILRPALLAGGK